MTRSTRSIAYLAEVAAGNRAEVLLLRKELIEAMRVNKVYATEVGSYERENQRLRHATKLMIAAGTPYELRSMLQAVFDAAMGGR